MDNFKKSIYFDLRFLTLSKISVPQRILLLVSKYQALIGILLKEASSFRVGKIRISVSSVSDIGTVQSSIVDYYDDVVRSGIITKKSPLIVDIGANIGQFTSAVKLFHPKARIVSFEPDPAIFNRYKSSVEDYKDIKPHNVGLANKKGSLTFYVKALSATSSFSKIMSSNAVARKKLSVLTLDSYELKAIDLLKIDVEGFEHEVIQGARNTLKQAKHLLIETSLNRQPTTTNIDMLHSIGHTVKNAHIIKMGRPLGKKSLPSCQDLLIKLGE